MPDSFPQGSDFDDDGMELPHLDMDGGDKDGNHHHDYKAYRAEEQRKQALEEAKEVIESFAPKVEHHYEPNNRRDYGMDYDPLMDEDLEDQREHEITEADLEGHHEEEL